MTDDVGAETLIHDQIRKGHLKKQTKPVEGDCHMDYFRNLTSPPWPILFWPQIGVLLSFLMKSIITV